MKLFFGLTIILLLSFWSCKNAVDIDSKKVTKISLEVRCMLGDSLCKTPFSITSRDTITKLFSLLKKSVKIPPGTRIIHANGVIFLNCFDEKDNPVFCADYTFFSEYGHYFTWYECTGFFRAKNGSFRNDDEGNYLLSIVYQHDQNCPKNSHANLTITNKSNIRIRSIIYWNYPDTLIEKVNPKYDGTEGLLKNKSFTMHAPLLSCWESVFTNGREEWIYFFNADTIETLNWDTVRQTHRGLLERRQIDLDYLQKNDFTIMFQ